jgi:hypothetical protein
MGVNMAARAKGPGQAKRPTGAAKPPVSAKRSPSANPKTPAEPKTRANPPVALRLAAVAQAMEAVGLCVAAVFAAVATADGKSYQTASGVALTLIAIGTAVGVAAIAAGLARMRSWSRTPAAMTQLFVVIAGIMLLDGHRPAWGVPALGLAAACVAGLLTPASLRALNRPPVKTG